MTSQRSTRTLLRVLLLSAVMLVAFASPSAASVSTLYAATGGGGDFTTGNCGGSLSSLYTLDPSTGAATLVGNITIGATQVRHVTGLAVHPSTGVLYGYMNGQDTSTNCTDFGLGTLLTIDKATGAATIVGSQGVGGLQSPDMTFDPFGTLYAWGESGGCTAGISSSSCTDNDDLYTLNTTTGTSTMVGECNCGTSATGLAVDSNGRMYLKSRDFLERVNQFTGHVFGGMSLSPTGNYHNMLAFGPSNIPYTGTRGSNGVGFTLKTINLSTGAVTTIGSNSVNQVSALAWDLGTVTAPTQSDLSLDKSVDNASPSDWGDNVVFTISVGVDSGSNATGVKVKDLLPSGFSYVSDNSGGDYNSSTGIWDVGTVVFGVPDSIAITASLQQTGSWVNTAEVVEATTYDPDSVPGSGEGDTFDTQVVSPAAIPGVDASADVVVSGPSKTTATSKGFSVLIKNVGTLSFPVTNGDLNTEVNGNSGASSCKAFSTTLKPGRSVRAHCSANLSILGLSPGDTVTYSGTVDVQADGFPNNDTDEENRTAS